MAIWVSWTGSTNTTTSPWEFWADSTSSITASLTWDAWTQVLAGIPVPSVYTRATTSPGPTPEAHEKAEELLLANLDAEQAAEYRENKTFHVHTADGTRRYRIERGRSGNVKLIGADGRPSRSYCIHPSDGRIPLGDVALAQKLMLETDEAEFLRIANETVLVHAGR